ncbi:MAG: ABC transporter permease [Gammaproteobacteria bacterium]|nr:ABC transporter permease [Gammaproteobacteria bacterium]
MKARLALRFRRFLAIFNARNREFLRDRSTLGWNIILPVVLVVGLGFIFSSSDKPMFKVAVVHQAESIEAIDLDFLDTRYVQFFSVPDVESQMPKVARHQVDMLLDLSDPRSPHYWINDTSPRGYVLEKMLPEGNYQREIVTGREVRYVDWLVPGVLGMNMMFSCLFGVGYVIVRYRKSGFLKRLNATPLAAIEFLAAQIVSRLWLVMAITIAVFVGTDLFLDFMMNGSWLLLLLITVLGAISMIALGLMLAARVTSEELAGGLLNLVTWPMMILSGVWFSLEGTPQIVQWASVLFPLTHMLDGARAVMIDGAGIVDVFDHLLILLAMTVAFLVIGAMSFRWKED